MNAIFVGEDRIIDKTIISGSFRLNTIPAVVVDYIIRNCIIAGCIQGKLFFKVERNIIV